MPPNQQDQKTKRQLLVDLFCILLGINSLIATNGLWVELPVMVPRLPEGWELPAYLTVIIQIANIGPITYSIMAYKLPNKVTEARAIYFMLAIGLLASLFLILFWSNSLWIFRDYRSVPLLVLTFFLALVDSISSVVCLPFMAVFQSRYVTSYMIGESLGGFLPSIMAFAQGVDDNVQCSNLSVFNYSSNYTEYRLQRIIPKPNFAPELFFTFLFLMMLCSSAGFVMLNHLPLSKREKVKKIPDASLREVVPLSNSSEKKTKVVVNNSSKMIVLLFTQFWVSLLGYGVLPSIQSFSCLPYGNEAYHYAVILCSVATPVASVIAIFIPTKRVSMPLLLSIITTIISIYLMQTAVASPAPPFVDTKLGSVVVVLSWTLFTFLFGYIKVIVAVICGSIGHRALFWCGALTQIGSASGALVMFLIVSVFHLFHEKESC